MLDIQAMKDFTNPPKWPQGGLMGMALHPTMYGEWPNPSKPWVYIAYVYHYAASAGCSNGTGSCIFKTRIARYDYDRSAHSLSNPMVIIESLNGSNDHNSGRLTIGRINGSSYLFYTIGDMGAGQFNNIGRINNAQARDISEGAGHNSICARTGSRCYSGNSSRRLRNDHVFRTGRVAVG